MSTSTCPGRGTAGCRCTSAGVALSAHARAPRRRSCRARGGAVRPVAEVGELRVDGAVAGVLHAVRRHAGGDRRVHRLVRRAPRRPRRSTNVVELVAPRQPLGRGQVGEVVAPEQRGERPPVGVVPAGDRPPTGRRRCSRYTPCGAMCGSVLPVRGPRAAVHRLVEDRRAEEVDARLGLGEVEVLPLAGAPAVVERGEQRAQRQARRRDSRCRRRTARDGGRSGQPVRWKKPASEAPIVPNPAYCCSGPVWPNRQVDIMTSDGFSCASRSYSSPRACLPRGEYDSTTTSAQRTRSSSTSRPPLGGQVEADAALAGRHVEQQARTSRCPGTSLTNGPTVRATSRCRLFSMRTTVAPKSAITRVVAGPAIAQVRSSTLTPGERGAALARRRRCRRPRRSTAACAHRVGVLAEARRPAEAQRRCRLPATPTGPGAITGSSVEQRVVDVVEEVARRELRAGDHVVRRGHRGDQQHPVARRLEQLGLGLASRRTSPMIALTRSNSAIGSLPSQQQVRVLDPVLVAGGLVAEALLVDPLHQPAGERADRRAEQERDRDEAVLARPAQLHVEAAGLDPAGHPLGRRRRRARTASE